jgi:hypothetical protein
MTGLSTVSALALYPGSGPWMHRPKDHFGPRASGVTIVPQREKGAPLTARTSDAKLPSGYITEEFNNGIDRRAGA